MRRMCARCIVLVYVSGVCVVVAGAGAVVLVGRSCCDVFERCRGPGVCERCRCCGVLGALCASV